MAVSSAVDGVFVPRSAESKTIKLVLDTPPLSQQVMNEEKTEL